MKHSEAAFQTFTKLMYGECIFLIIFYFSLGSLDWIKGIFVIALVVSSLAILENLKRKVPEDQFMYLKKAFRSQAYSCLAFAFFIVLLYFLHDINGFVMILAFIICGLLGIAFAHQYQKIK